MSYKRTLKTWIPPHFKTNEYVPLIDSMGELLDDLRLKIDEFFDENLITLSKDTTALHGEERGIRRIKYEIGGQEVLESDDDFKNRIQRFKYTCSSENIIENTRSVSLIQDIEIRPDFDALPVGDELSEVLVFRGYGNYGPLDLKKRRNCFSVLINLPIRRPLSFLDKDTFLDKNAFLDRPDRVIDDEVIQAIQTLIIQKSPAGSAHRLLINGFAGTRIGDEASQEKALNSR